jgi:hypothetical protein
MLWSWKLTAVLEEMLAAVRLIYGAPLVVFTMLVNVAPVWVPRVAEVVTRPLGIVHVPLAIVQYWNLIDPTLPVVATVKPNK